MKIAPHRLELAPGIEVPTFAYNGQVPGPVLRMPAGKEAIFEIENYTTIPEVVHWHGLQIPSEVDGAAAEGTPMVEPFGRRRYVFAPRKAGTHWYHTHTMGGTNLNVGAYTGLFGFMLLDDGTDPGDYDREVLVAMHHWDPRWVEGTVTFPDLPQHGYDVAYRYGSMNGRLLGHADPVRVREGERVLFRILNASATEITFTALAGHKMRVIAMDGQPVPRQREIGALMLGPAERADVIVEMNNPGKWILGAVKDKERAAGMGLVVEYENATGEPKWLPVPRHWDYLWFAEEGPVPEPDEILEIRIGEVPGGPGGHNIWKMNGKSWPDTPRLRVVEGRRYRLRFINETEHGHPMHLHRHHFEVANYGGRQASGLLKDTINVRPHMTADLDFTADNPGPTLIHCHQAAHQDLGLMALMLYEGDEEPAVDEDALERAIAGKLCESGKRV